MKIRRLAEEWRIELIYSSPKVIHSQEPLLFHIPEDSIDKSDSQGLYIFYLNQNFFSKKK